MSAWSVKRDGDARIEIVGDIRTDDAGTLWRTLDPRTQNYAGPVEIDLAQLGSIDGVAIALLLAFRNALVARGIACTIVNAPASAQSLLDLYRNTQPIAEEPPRPRRPNVITAIGKSVESTVRRVYEPVVFAGELVSGSGQVARRPRLMNWRVLPSLIVQAGADAILIVLLLDFLIGFVIALQSAPVLVSYGANVFVADLVGVSVTRELVPLMTAIIMAGRSGAAITAELATMHVSEEIDALETMGISPIPFLVLPRITALVIVAPMLVLIGDVAAVVGGLVVAVMTLDLTPQGYISELRTMIVASDIWTGAVKGAIFAGTIGIIGSQEGLAARGAAAGVGRRTTATVVASLFVVVVLDTLLTLIFRAWSV